jgi:hypothetical protein
MAIRFTSYEWYKQLLAAPDGTVSGKSTFLGTSPKSHPKFWRKGPHTLLETQHSSPSPMISKR